MSVPAPPDAHDGLAAGEASAAKGALVRGGALRIAGFFATVLLSLVSASLLTRHLGVSRFGDYTTILSLVAVIAVVTDSGMTNIGTRDYVTLDGTARRQLLADLLGLRIALSLIGVGLVAGAAAALGFGESLELGALAASLATVALVFQHTLTIPLAADMRLGWLSLLEFVRQAVAVVCVVIFVAAGAGVLPLLTTTLIANVVLIVPSVPLVRGRISLRPGLSVHRWRELLGATVAFSLATAVGIVYVYTAQILTHIVAGRYESGLFSISFRVFIVTAGIPSLLVSSALPVLSRAAHDDRDGLGYILQRIFEVLLIGGVGLAVTESAGAGFIVQVIDSHAHRAVPVLEIQSFALIASFVTAGWGFGLLSLRHHRDLLLANAVAFAVSLAATLVLAASDGARGAAIATICGEAALAACSLTALIIRHPEYRPRLAIAARVLGAGAVAAVAGLVPSIPSLPRAVLAFATYAVIVVATGALPPEFRALVPRRRGRLP